MDKIRLFATVFLLSVAINANAALNDLGNGLVNDTTLNITWLQMVWSTTPRSTSPGCRTPIW